MIEDGVLEYDFYYAPGDSIVHPALDRMALLLTPEGVRSHSVTDGKWQRDTSDPLNVSDLPSDAVQGRPVNLLPSAWNHLQLQFEAPKFNWFSMGCSVQKFYPGIQQSSVRLVSLCRRIFCASQKCAVVCRLANENRFADVSQVDTVRCR